jgi:hypothetical protein
MELENSGVHQAKLSSTEAPNPLHIVTVTDVSPDTLRDIIAHLEVSTEFDHFVYREAELDAAWSITGQLLAGDRQVDDEFALASLHAGLHEAHNLVAAHRPTEAAKTLRDLL